MLEGEPGIGKTRLLREFANRVATRGARVLWARASEAEIDVPFALWDAALDARLRELGDRGIERLGVDGLTALSGLLPALGAGTSAAGTHEVHRALRSLLSALAGPRPLLVCLDDVHWADPASVDTLVALAHRPTTGDVQLALTLREGRLAPRLDAALADGVRDGRTLWLRLGPLASAAAAILARGDEEVVATGAGNPFLLEQLTRARELAAQGPTGRIAIPEALAAAIHAETSALPATARVLLEGAAVGGDPCDVDLAAACAGVDPNAALAALDELLKPGLLRPAGPPRVFAFRHPLVRESVEAGMSPGARLAAHARAGEVLAARGAPALRLARHIEHAAAPGDETALALLLRATDEAQALAPATAARTLQAALRLLAANDSRQLVLERRLADALMAAGQPAEGHAVLLAALERAPSDARPGLIANIANAPVGSPPTARRRGARGRLRSWVHRRAPVRLRQHRGRGRLRRPTRRVLVLLLGRATLGERLDRRRFLGIAVALAGAATVSASQGLGGRGNPAGPLLVLAAVCCYAPWVILSKRAVRTMPSQNIAAWSTWLAAFMTLPVSGHVPHDLAQAPTSAITAVIFLGIVVTTAPLVLWTWVLTRVPASSASSSLLLIGPSAILVSWIVPIRTR